MDFGPSARNRRFPVIFSRFPMENAGINAGRKIALKQRCTDFSPDARLDVFQNPVGFGTRPAVSQAKAL
jgi:hypothetical protein